jgi:hypothetical protein
VTSSDHDLVGDGTGSNLSSGDPGGDLVGYTAAQLFLGPLQDNGGPTQTMALLLGSPALDAGDGTASGLPGTDQRGFARVSGAAVDIGAFELQEPSFDTTALANGTYGTPYSQTITATATGDAAGPFTFAVTPGTLPPGLSLASNGTLSGTPTAAGSFSFTVTATDSDSDTGSHSYTLMIDKADLYVTATANSKTYGQTASDTGTLSGLVNGNSITAGFASTGDVAGANAGSYAITAALADPNHQLANYTVHETDATLTVTPATPSVTVSDAGGTYDGSAFAAAAQVNGSASLEGVSPTLTYYAGSQASGTPLSGAPSAAGTYTVVATFAGSADYAAATSAPLTFTISPAQLQGTANPVSDFSFESPSLAANSYQYNPTGSPWTFSGTSGIESDGGAFSAAKAPDGSQAAILQSIDSGSAGQISQTVTLDPGTYYISFWAAQRQGYGVNPIQVQVDGQNVGSPISPASTSWALYQTVSFTITSAGSHTIAFVSTVLSNGDDHDSFIDAVTVVGPPPSSDSIAVTDTGGTYNGNPFPANATAVGIDGTTPVSGSFSYTYYVGLSTSGTSLGSTAPTNAGTYTVVATFTSSDGNYTGGSAQTTFTINAAAPTLTVSDAGGTYNGSAFAASASVAGAVAGVDATPAATLEGVAPTLSYYRGSYTSLAQFAGLTPLGGAPVNAGAYTVLASFPGSADYSSGEALVTFTVAQASPTVTWASPAAITYGTALSAAQLDATADVPGSFAYDVAAGTVLGAGTHTLTVTFTPDDSADYQSVTRDVTLAVDRATPTVTWADPAAIPYGTPLGGTQLDATADVPGSFAYNVAAGTVLGAGIHTLSVTFTPADTADYEAVSARVTMTVGRATATVTVGGTFTYDGSAHAGTAAATGVDGSPVSGQFSFTYNGLSTPPVTAGTYTVLAHFHSADPNYADADSPAGTLVIHPAPPTTVGVFEFNTATWKLRHSNSPGAPDVAPFAYGGPTSAPVWGDWDGDGTFSVGVVDVVPNPYVPGGIPLLRWQLKNTNAPGVPDLTFLYGEQGDIPVVGDWDGNGTFTVGVFEPDTAVWKLKNTNQQGAPDLVFAYGQRGDIPVVGDWDGNGTTTVGVARTGAADLTWYLRNSNGPGAPDIAPFAYGARGDTPVVGDWDGDRLTTVGAFDPASATWRLRNSNSPGAPDVAPFAYGDWPNRSRPVLGGYGPGAVLQAAGGAGAVDPQAAPLSQPALDGAVQAALTRLHEAGVSDAVLGRLGQARVQVGDLPGAELGLAFPASGTVLIDRTAAGHGWFVDPTPLMNEEFDASGQALAGGPATGRMDLLTAVLHELGHLAGLPDVSAATDPTDLMGEQLADGDRRTAALDQVFARTSF